MSTERPAGFELPVYILAGGRSRRFGSDKARTLVDGRPMIVRLADSLTPVARSVTIVAASEGSYDDLGLNTIGDVVADQGPAGGVLTALDHAVASDRFGGWVFVAACDIVGARVEWVHELFHATRDGAHAVVFEGDQLEPLFGLYHASARDHVAACVESDTLAMQSILKTLDTVTVPAPSEWNRVVNANRASDLR